MRVTEQVDALETLAYDPVAYLVVPRMLAGLVMFPVVVGVAMMVGLIAGWWASMGLLDMSSAQFIKGARLFFDVFDVRYGLVKAASFGVAVTAVGCACGPAGARRLRGRGRGGHQGRRHLGGAHSRSRRLLGRRLAAGEGHMKKRSNDFLLGAVILGAIALIISVSLYLRESDIGTKRSQITARFRDVGQVQVGNAVVIRGVKAGKVERIELATGGGCMFASRWTRTWRCRRTRCCCSAPRRCSANGRRRSPGVSRCRPARTCTPSWPTRRATRTGRWRARCFPTSRN